MLNDKTLVFRYDNVPHHPEVKSFPHHKHLKSDLLKSEEPDFLVILNEIKNLK